MPVDPRIQAALNAPLRAQAARFGAPRGKRRNGYPTLPGSGPAGETCGSCMRLVRREFARTYFKCALTETGGAATDIKKSSPACSSWVRADG
ncbi:hypothetical protein DFR49_2312 [Hephaestia caeni]|uniref:Uncharacterized protein n=1 Tax=Hephaestia caeni TaxID=645617 RepID=A0A397PA60_9SPHN|nr:hypothetical protein [Hephaestia caeni]RIA44075.1 hypothetical protein DFR49_2312 [Hephaestia caeni]